MLPPLKRITLPSISIAYFISKRNIHYGLNMTKIGLSESPPKQKIKRLKSKDSSRYFNVVRIIIDIRTMRQRYKAMDEHCELVL